MPLLLILLLFAWLFYDGDGDPVQGLSDALARISRGGKLTRAPYDHETGVVPGDPQALADQAGLTLDQYALARMLASEEGSSDNLIKTAVVWATINQSRALGKDIAGLLTHAREPSHSGSFGTFKNIDPSSPLYKVDSQGRPIVADRYASTALDPFQGDADIAGYALAGTVPDPTGGATHFDRPGGEKDPDHIAQIRAREGLRPMPVPGIDPTELRFWA